MKQLLFLFVAVLTSSYTFSQPGTIDINFGNKGLVYNSAFGIHRSVLQQPDGKLLTAGGYDEPGGNIARFLSNGTVDSSFGKAGFTGYPPLGEAYDMLLQKDGKIVVVGRLTLEDGGHSYVARLQFNGNFDSSFGENGITLIPNANPYDAYLAIALAPDGSIVIAGPGETNDRQTSYSIVSHLSANGAFDDKFGDKGRVLNYTNSTDLYENGLAIQKDGKILLAGHTLAGGDDQEDYALSRYNSDGTIDDDFGSHGTVITQGVQGLTGHDAPCDIVVQPDGKIVIGGTSSGYNFIIYMAALRYNTDGTLDKTFGSQGRAFVSFEGKKAQAYSILLQPDGRIILSGSAYNTAESDFALCRLTADGTIDSSFGVDGKQLTAFTQYATAYCATLQQDGKIVQGGSYYNNAEGYDSYLLVRYNGDKEQKPLIARIKKYLQHHGIIWQGMADKNTSYYSVQYSKTGNGFTEKGKVSGLGGSAFEPYNYNVTEAGYYRVVAVDRKGYKTFSNKVLVTEADVAAVASVFPNPARNYVTVNGLPTSETANISISDGSGTVKVKGVSNGSTQYRSPLTNMLPGTYYVNITTGAKTETLKFVKE